MGLTSLQVCMDSASSDWLQGTSHEDSPGMESSPSPLSPNDMLTCSRPVSMDRRLRPPHDQALKCPRCDSTHTKFCYYNNYSLTQPRYFCKTCRRYWTKGGTLRNIPVGGGCRKNKKPSSSSKKQNDNAHPAVGQNGTTDLQLSFPDQLHFSHIATNLFGHNDHLNNSNSNFLPIDFMESKLEGIVGNSHNYDFMGNNGNVGMVNLAHHHGLLMEHDFHGNNICAPFGMSLLHGNNNLDTTTTATTTTIAANNGVFLDTCQRLMLPYNGMNHNEQSAVDVKPNAKLLSLDWQQEQACSSDGHAGPSKDSFGYLNALGSWPSMVNNYGPSTTNPLV